MISEKIKCLKFTKESKSKGLGHILRRNWFTTNVKIEERAAGEELQI